MPANPAQTSPLHCDHHMFTNWNGRKDRRDFAIKEEHKARRAKEVNDSNAEAVNTLQGLYATASSLLDFQNTYFKKRVQQQSNVPPLPHQ